MFMNHQKCCYRKTDRGLLRLVIVAVVVAGIFPAVTHGREPKQDSFHGAWRRRADTARSPAAVNWNLQPIGQWTKQDQWTKQGDWKPLDKAPIGVDTPAAVADLVPADPGSQSFSSMSSPAVVLEPSRVSETDPSLPELTDPSVLRDVPVTAESRYPRTETPDFFVLDTGSQLHSLGGSVVADELGGLEEIVTPESDAVSGADQQAETIRPRSQPFWQADESLPLPTAPEDPASEDFALLDKGCTSAENHWAFKCSLPHYLDEMGHLIQWHLSELFHLSFCLPEMSLEKFRQAGYRLLQPAISGLCFAWELVAVPVQRVLEFPYRCRISLSDHWPTVPKICFPWGPVIVE